MDFDLAKIKELISIMGRTKMKSIHIKDKDYEITLEKQDLEGGKAPTTIVSQSPAMMPAQAAAPQMDVPSVAEPVKEDGKFIESPLVGCFYQSNAPGADALVKVGDTVSEDTVVCIIEAMKVMNEVKSGMKGVIEEVLQSDGHPVEYGAKLFKIKPL